MKTTVTTTTGITMITAATAAKLTVINPSGSFASCVHDLKEAKPAGNAQQVDSPSVASDGTSKIAARRTLGYLLTVELSNDQRCPSLG